MHEPRPSATSTSPACCEAAISAMRTTSSATLRRLARGRGGRGAAPRRRRSGRTGTRTCSPCRRPVISESSSSARSVSAAVDGEHAGDDRAQHVGIAIGRARLHVHAASWRPCADVRAAEDVADLAERRERHLGVARSTPRSGTACRRCSGSNESSDRRVEVAEHAEHDGADRRPRRSRRRRRRPPGRARARSGRGGRPDWPEHARKRRRGVARADVRHLTQRVELHVGQFMVRHAPRPRWAVRSWTGWRRRRHRRARRSPRSGRSRRRRARRRRTGQRRVADLGGQRARDQLALADEPLDDQGQPRGRRPADDDDVAGVRRRARSRAPRRGRSAAARRRVSTSIAPPGHRPHGLLGEVHGALDPLERDRERRLARPRRAAPA